MIAEIILLFSASSTGWYYKFMTHKANRIMFSGTRTCIESRIKLECEKEQQEQLLLSVIPAYIAAEVFTKYSALKYCIIFKKINTIRLTKIKCPLSKHKIINVRISRNKMYLYNLSRATQCRIS